MTEYLGQHWVATIIITILLGAIGSGLWDAALKPYGAKFTNFLYSVVTFNLKKTRDSDYESAAMGHHELPSLYILLFLLIIMVVPLFISPSLYLISSKFPEISSVESSECKSKPPEEKRACLRLAIKSNSGTALLYLTIPSIFLSVIIFRRFHSVNKSNLIVTYFYQALRSIRPLIDENKYHIYEQQFSLMRTEEDFNKLIAEIHDCMLKNNLSSPNYKP